MFGEEELQGEELQPGIPPVIIMQASSGRDGFVRP